MTTGYPEPPTGPDGATRTLTSRLASICRDSPAVYAALVRRNDARRAAGLSAAEAWTLTLAEHDEAGRST